MINIKNNLIEIKTNIEQKDATNDIKMLNDRHFNWENYTWEVKINKSNLENIINIAFKHNISISKEFKKIAINNLKINTDNENYKRLFPFQKCGIEKLVNRNRLGLFDQMGLGKTIEVAVAIPNNEKVICIVPASLKYNWQQELKTWSNYKNIEILNGRNSFKLPEKNQIVITNYDILPDVESLKNIDFSDFIIILDEVHACKNYKTNKTKKTKEITKKAKIVWGLTGTPLLNKPNELWQILSTIGIAKETFFSYSNFMKLFNAYKSRFGIVWGAPEKEVSERLKNTTLRRERKDVLKELPDEIHTQILVNINKRTIKKLDKAEKELDLVIKNAKKQKVLNSQEKFPHFSKLSEIRKFLADLKVETMLEIIKLHEENETPLIVFSAHVNPIEQIKDRSGWKIITGKTSQKNRHEIVTNFQSGKLKGIGCTIKAAGVGLTLTHAAKTLFVDLEWTPALNEQACGRTNRIGQKNKCEYMYLIANHSIDKRLHKLLSIKQTYIKAINDSKISDSTFIITKLNQCKVSKNNIEPTKNTTTKNNINENKNKFNILTGIYTVSNEDSHKTFRISIQSENESFAPRKTILSIFKGSENYNLSNYKSFAFINNNNINIWKRYKDNEELLKWTEILWKLINGNKIDGYKLDFSITCIVCNKLLTNPKSIEIGIGPECIKKFKMLFAFMS